MNPQLSSQVNLASSALLTDLYQLTMLQGYHDSGMEEIAVFEFFVRKLRPGRGFLMAAGLEQALQFLEGLRFSAEELAWLAIHRPLQRKNSLRVSKRCASPAMCMRCRKARYFFRTSRSCASPRRSRRRNWSRRG